jgi:leucyl aminopeptidase
MRVNVALSSEVSFESVETCLVVPVFEGDFPLNSDVLQEDDEALLQALVDKEILRGKAQETHYMPTPNERYKGVLVLGLGKKASFNAEVLRRTAGKACATLKNHHIAHVYLDVSHHADLPVGAFLEGIVLGQYEFDVYKTKDKKEAKNGRVTDLTVLIAPDGDVEAVQQVCRKAVLVALSTNGARHLANTASNEMTPSALADFAQGLSKNMPCECTILDQVQMSSLGMNALLGVAKGSAEPPKLIVLHYHYSDDAKTVALVGKGVTFDSGGISIKPGEGMHEMKFDMCGAAAVLCTMMNVLELKPAVNVVAVVPAAENKTGAAAQTPGDIVRAYNGKTIEVHNTDAEGRLILADALAYTVDKYKPSAIIDVATLTGACVVALGHYAAGLLGNDADLMDALQEAGEATGERVWPLPLWEDYQKLVEGTHADLCNIGPKGEAGTITAAAFIKEFVGDTPWAHLDIAGTAWGGKHIPHLDPQSATGYGVRLLTEWLLEEGAENRPEPRGHLEQSDE